jgi:hypothetical protein
MTIIWEPPQILELCECCEVNPSLPDDFLCLECQAAINKDWDLVNLYGDPAGVSRG